MRKFALLAICTAAFLVARTAQATTATILYATDFNASPTPGHTAFSSPSTTNSYTAADYVDGPIIGQDGWLITGTSVVNPINVANSATNGNVTLTTTGQDVNRIYGASLGATSGSVYMSADIDVTAAATGDYFIHLGDGTTTDFYARTYVKSSGSGFVMGLATSSGTVTYGTTVLNLNTVYHMVSEYDFVTGSTTNDTASLYINPTDTIVGGSNLYVAGTTTGTDATVISSVNLRQGTAGSAPNVIVDNIAVAVTNPVTVPEPASILLGGLGLLSLIGLARRKLA